MGAGGYLSDQFNKYKNITINQDTAYMNNGLHIILLLLEIVMSKFFLFLLIKQVWPFIHLQIISSVLF